MVLISQRKKHNFNEMRMYYIPKSQLKRQYCRHIRGQGSDETGAMQ